MIRLTPPNSSEEVSSKKVTFIATTSILQVTVNTKLQVDLDSTMSDENSLI